MNNKPSVIMKRLSEIHPYDNNPRYNDGAVDAVANSIQEFGFKVPMVITADGEIVSGHTRYKAAQKLGLTEVPVIIADDLSEEQIKAFRLADNKTAELAIWNFEALDLELDDIIGIDMSQFGFSDIEYDFGDVADLSTNNYEEPEIKQLRCPHCGKVDNIERFVKV